MKRRVVLDTNVLVSALRSRRGASHRLLSLVGTGSFEHCVSVGLLFEYEAVLKRRGSGIHLAERNIDDVLDYVVASARRQTIHYLWRPVLRDPSDDLVLEVAVAGGCVAIITFNIRDFVGSEQFGIRALTPAQYLSELERDP